MREWMSMVSDYSSMHGFAWYNRVENHCLRCLGFILSVMIILGLPMTLIHLVKQFLQTELISNFVEWKTAKNIYYPHITVCNPKYFDTRFLRSKWYVSCKMCAFYFYEYYIYSTIKADSPAQLWTISKLLILGVNVQSKFTMLFS